MVRVRSLVVTVVVLAGVLSIGTAVSAETTMSQAVLAKFAQLEQQYGLPTGVMAKIARIESGGNARATNPYSTAAGLFQWLKSSWYFTSLKVNNGNPHPPDARFDPFIASEVTAYSLGVTKSKVGGLIQAAGADLSVGLYMGHFLGVGGATRFFQALASNPGASAAQTFPREAASNREVFASRSLSEVYNYFAQKMNQSGITSVANAGTFDGNIADSRILNASSQQILMNPYRGPPPPPDPTRTFQTTPADFVEGTPPPANSTNVPQGSSGPRTQVTSSSTPLASLIIAQSTQILRGKTTLISWVSVGMKLDSCSVSQSGYQFANGNEGSKILTPGLMEEGTITLILECAPFSGTTIRKSVDIVIQP